MAIGEVAGALAALGSAASTLIQRQVLRQDRASHLSYAVLYNFGGALVLLPFLYYYPPVPTNPAGWLYAGIATALWAVIGVLGFFNAKKVEAPKLIVLKRFKVVAIAAMSVLFLGEVLSPQKLGAFLLIIASALLLTYEGKKLKLDRQSLLVLFTAFLTAGVMIADKAALQYFPLPAYAFIVFLVPGLLVFGYAKTSFNAHLTNLAGLKKWVAADVLVDAVTYLLILFALQNMSATSVVLLQELSLPIVAIGGIVLLKEKRDLKKVAAAVALALAGSVLLVL